MSPFLVLYGAGVVFLVLAAMWGHVWRRQLSKHALDDKRSPYWGTLQLLDSSRYDQRGKQLLKLFLWSTAVFMLAWMLLTLWAVNLASNR